MKFWALAIALLLASPLLAECPRDCPADCPCGCKAQKAKPAPVSHAKPVRSVSQGHVTPSVKGMTIEYHLTNHHGIDIRGMTVEQMEAAHQAAHRNGGHVMQSRGYQPMRKRGLARWK